MSTSVARVIVQDRFLKNTTFLSGRALAGFAALVSTVAVSDAHAACTPVYTGGAGNVVTCDGGNTTNINLTAAQRAILNWSNFNTGSGEVVNFNQQSGGVALNRITGGQTQFNGTLNATGQVFFVNGNGFVFGSGFSANVGGMIVSTADISNAEGSGFMTHTAGTAYHFSDTTAQIANATIRFSTQGGVVKARDGGYIAAIAPRVVVTDRTTLRSNGGDIAIGSGKRFDVTVDPAGDGLLSFTVTDPVVGANIANAVEISNGSTLDVSSSGTSAPDGGRILITAKALDSIYDNMILITGGALGASTLDAHSATGHGGGIVINADSNTGPAPTVLAGTSRPNNLVNIAGRSTLDAISNTGAANDGYIVINGRRDGVYDNSNHGIIVDNLAYNLYGPIGFGSGSGGFQTRSGRTTLIGNNGSTIRPCAVVNGAGTGCPAAPPDAAPDMAPDMAPDSPPDSPPDSRPDSKPDSRPDSPPDSPPDSRPDSKPDAPPALPDSPVGDSDFESPPDSAPDSKPDSRPDSPPDSPPDSRPDSKPDAPPALPDSPVGDSDFESPPDSAPDSKPDSRPDSPPGDGEPDSEPDSAPDSAPDSRPDTPPQAIIDPLDRKVLSLRDDSVLDKNFIYESNPYINNQLLDLSLLGNGGGTPAPINTANLGDLAPAAGGDAKGLGELSPSAGGITPGSTSFCANTELDAGWSKTNEERNNCDPRPGKLKTRQ